MEFCSAVSSRLSCDYTGDRFRRTVLLRLAAFRAAIFVVAGAASLFAGPQLDAASRIYNFENGIDDDFCTNNSGNLWTLDLDGPAFRVSKPADNGTFENAGFIFGNLTSNFSLSGNFLVTVDFTLPDFPAAAPNPDSLNESVLAVTAT